MAHNIIKKEEAASETETASQKTHLDNTTRAHATQEQVNSTFLSQEPEETDKTDQTDITITNAEFINGIMGELLGEGDARIAVVTKYGNPSDRGFQAKPWEGDDSILNDDFNNYFSFGRFVPTEEEGFRRKKKYFHDCLFIVLDDIGTKVPAESISLQPSWKIETSEGNYQYGYILKTLVNDLKILNQLDKAITRSGLTDEGMSGFTSRLARLPVAQNWKYDPPFRCKLREWNPEIRYSVDELYAGLGITPETVSEKAKKQKQAKQAQAFDSAIFTEAPTENPVLAELMALDLYKSELETGKHDITCPWVHEHTDQIDSGTAYFEPDEDYSLGGFKCMHAHCSTRRISNLLEYLGITASEAKLTATIKIIPGELHKVADSAEQVLAGTTEFYQRGGSIVSIINDTDNDKVSIKPCSKPALTYTLSKLIEWERYSSKAEEFVVCNPCGQTISILYDHIEYHYLPTIIGLSHQPYLREDHSLVCVEGYDADSKIYGVFDPEKYDIPANPTKEDARKAIIRIGELLEDFCFATKIDRSATLSAILTAATRASLPTAPMFHVAAPVIGSGKSYLCELISLFASGHKSTPYAFPGDEEECRKLLLSTFLTSPPVVEFDNLTTDIKAHKSLCTALTSPELSDRVLGISKTAAVSTRSLILSSGNNVYPINDMVRRCIPITLDTGEEIPAMRTYKNPNLIADVRAKREEFVSAALTIILAWVQSDEKLDHIKPLGSYGVWSNLCREPLIWLGYADPVENMLQAMQEDPERETLGNMLSLWHSQFGNIPKKVRDLVGAFGDATPELNELFHDIAGERDKVNRRRLGHYFKQHANRPVNGFKLLRAEQSSNAALWYVTKVEPQSV